MKSKYSSQCNASKFYFGNLQTSNVTHRVRHVTIFVILRIYSESTLKNDRHPTFTTPTKCFFLFPQRKCTFWKTYNGHSVVVKSTTKTSQKVFWETKQFPSFCFKLKSQSEQPGSVLLFLGRLKLPSLTSGDRKPENVKQGILLIFFLNRTWKRRIQEHKKPQFVHAKESVLFRADASIKSRWVPSWWHS